MYIIVSFLLCIIGLVMLITPKTIYQITESWKSSTAGAPSFLFLASTRFGGGILTLVGIAGMFLL